MKIASQRGVLCRRRAAISSAFGEMGLFRAGAEKLITAAEKIIVAIFIELLAYRRPGLGKRACPSAFTSRRWSAKV